MCLPLFLQILFCVIMKICGFRYHQNLQSFRVDNLMMLFVDYTQKFLKVTSFTKSFHCSCRLFPTSFTISSLFLNFSPNYIFLIIYALGYELLQCTIFHQVCNTVGKPKYLMFPCWWSRQPALGCLGSAQGFGKGSFENSEHAN